MLGVRSSSIWQLICKTEQCIRRCHLRGVFLVCHRRNKCITKPFLHITLLCRAPSPSTRRIHTSIRQAEHNKRADGACRNRPARSIFNRSSPYYYSKLAVNHRSVNK
ncbi:hypothetical protein IF2G_02049 [Cordyceps javanica]|nr:hypothetical protein IF2G_02049 [Cordyceps javanica]